MTKTFENGDPVGFIIVERDAAELHLSLDPSIGRAPSMWRTSSSMTRRPCTTISSPRACASSRASTHDFRAACLRPGRPFRNRIDVGEPI